MSLIKLTPERELGFKQLCKVFPDGLEAMENDCLKTVA